MDFNNTIYVDMFCIDGNSIIQAGDEATHYQAARGLSNISAEKLWLSFGSVGSIHALAHQTPSLMMQGKNYGPILFCEQVHNEHTAQVRSHRSPVLREHLVMLPHPYLTSIQNN